jgi:hypothetical protein
MEFKLRRDPWLIHDFNGSSGFGQVANDATDSVIAERDGGAF